MLPEDDGLLTLSGEGLAKTHECIVQFFATADRQAATRASQLSLVAEHPPYAYPDPAYACVTHVREDLRHKDKAFGGPVEDVIEKHLDGFAAMRDLSGPYGDGYGYFVYGDTPHATHVENFWRIWSHLFYCGPAMYWQLYFRSGDRKARDLADLNARHAMELDTGHVTSKRTRSGAANHDNSSVFHYYGAYPPSGGGYSNIMPLCANNAEYLCMAYQMTGDERARDVIDEVAGAFKWRWEAIKQTDPDWDARAEGYALKNLLELYEVTEDESLWEIANYWAGRIIKMVVVEDGENKGVALGYYGKDSPGDFTLAYTFSGTVHYLRLTGSLAMAEWAVCNAEYLLTPPGKSDPQFNFRKWDGLVCASFLTGNSKYAKAAYADMQSWANNQDPKDQILAKAWALYKAPIVLRAAEWFPDIVEP